METGVLGLYVWVALHIVILITRQTVSIFLVYNYIINSKPFDTFHLAH